MTAAEDELRRYLQLPPDGECRWDTNGDAVVLADDTSRTVALRSEVAAVLERMTGRAEVPPFQLVVAGFRHLRLGDVAPVGDEAKAVRGLTRSAPLGLARVVAHVLEHSPMAPWEVDGRTLAAGLDAGLPREGLSGSLHPIMASRADRAFAEALGRVGADAIERRLATEIDHQVTTFEALPLPVAEGSVRDVIEELARDPEHADIARLARELAAAVRLPAPTEVERDLPTGGYGDIANRGSLDRLLTSELASDDEILASRIVLGEALYLRREPPTETPDAGVWIVVDAGIRTWGVPRRVLAAATLTLAVGAEQGGAAHAVRAEGEQLADVNLATPEGFTQHLGTLTADLSPAAAVAAAPGPGHEGERRVLLTSRAAWAEGPLSDAVAARAAAGECWSVGTADGEGRFELMEVTGRGSRTIASVALDVSEAVARPEPKGEPADLPAYVHVLPSPLDISFVPRGIRVVTSLGNRYIFARGRRVLLAKASRKGVAANVATELAEAPKGHLVTLRATSGGALIVKYDGYRGQVKLASYGPEGEVATSAFPATGSPKAKAGPQGTALSVDGQVSWITPSLALDPVPEGGLQGLRPIYSLTAQSGEGLSIEPMLRRVSRVGIWLDPDDRDGGLALAGKNMRGLLLGRDHGPEVKWSWPGDVPMTVTRRTFALEDVPSSDGPGRFLSRHRWKDGSLLWMDRRGLLHLRSSDPDAPELTLALFTGDAPLEGWLSDGSFVGRLDGKGAGGPVAAWLRRYVERVTAVEGHGV